MLWWISDDKLVSCRASIAVHGKALNCNIKKQISRKQPTQCLSPDTISHVRSVPIAVQARVAIIREVLAPSKPQVGVAAVHASVDNGNGDRRALADCGLHLQAVGAHGGQARAQQA